MDEKFRGGKGVSMALGVMYSQKRVKRSERNVLRHLRKNEDVLCTVTAVFMCQVVLLTKSLLLFKLQLTRVVTLRWMSLLHASRGANMSLDYV